MDRFWELADVARLHGASDLLRQPRGLFAIGAVAVLIIYGISVGRTKALMSLLSIYVAYMLVVLFPFMDALEAQVPERSRDALSLVLFVLLYIGVFAALSRSMARGRLTLGEISIVQVILISVVQIGLLAAIGVSLLPAEMGARLFGPAHMFLAGPRALWGWAAASLLILPLLKGRRKE